MSCRPKRHDCLGEHFAFTQRLNNTPFGKILIRALLLILGLCIGFIQCGAKPKPEEVEAVDLPREIFTGENLKTEADMRRVVETIKIAPRGARFSKQQLKGMEDILVALLNVAASEKIDLVRFSASCDLFATLDSTMSGKEGWRTIQSEAKGEDHLVDLAAVIAVMKTWG
ncbi:MAG TPA: hypothetical protein VMM36_08020 [Opitutaceae bacterium]|nr:hypothetical protein [Opitutaceae bacterium]